MKNGLLSGLLSPAFQNASRIASMLEEHYSTFNEIAEADIDFLSKTLSDTSPAFYIKIAAALVSRRGCDRFKFGKKHTFEEIEEYLKHLFFGVGNETVYIISIGQGEKIISADKVSEGTVNFSNVTPRMMIEVAKKRGASSVILAHNHPGGYAFPSSDDKAATALLTDLFSSSGIKLVKHYVVAGNDCKTV